MGVGQRARKRWFLGRDSSEECLCLWVPYPGQEREGNVSVCRYLGVQVSSFKAEEGRRPATWGQEGDRQAPGHPSQQEVVVQWREMGTPLVRAAGVGSVVHGINICGGCEEGVREVGEDMDRTEEGAQRGGAYNYSPCLGVQALKRQI